MDTDGRVVRAGQVGREVGEGNGKERDISNTFNNKDGKTKVFLFCSFGSYMGKQTTKNKTKQPINIIYELVI